MSGKYECGKCGLKFIAGDEYENDPQKRSCPSCQAIGEIMYHGSGKCAPGVISDYIGYGLQGIKNPVDGKMYDSKSQYYRAVKSNGCVVMGNDAPREGKQTMSGDFDCSRELKAALQQHTRGGSLTIDPRR